MNEIEDKNQENKPVFRQEEVQGDYNLHQSIVNNSLKEVKRDTGMFFTPEGTVDFMVNI